jgi:hypothetical protein
MEPTMINSGDQRQQQYGTPRHHVEQIEQIEHPYNSIEYYGTGYKSYADLLPNIRVRFIPTSGNWIQSNYKRRSHLRPKIPNYNRQHMSYIPHQIPPLGWNNAQQVPPHQIPPLGWNNAQQVPPRQIQPLGWNNAQQVLQHPIQPPGWNNAQQVLQHQIQPPEPPPNFLQQFKNVPNVLSNAANMLGSGLQQLSLWGGHGKPEHAEH